MAKVPFNEEFFREFQANPEATFQKFGIKGVDPAFLAEARKQRSFQDFKNFLEKSKFFAFFDFNA